MATEDKVLILRGNDADTVNRWLAEGWTIKFPPTAECVSISAGRAAFQEVDRRGNIIYVLTRTVAPPTYRSRRDERL